MKKFSVKLVKGYARANQKQLATLKGLGLNKLNQKRELEINQCNVGMLRKVQHLISVDLVG